MDILLVVVALVLALGIIIFIAKKRKSRTEVSKIAPILEPSTNINENIQPTNKKTKLKSFKNIRKTKDQIVEESWGFLNDITNKVLALFSPKAQQELLQIGRKLFNIGVIYQHVIDESLLNAASATKDVTHIAKEEAGRH